MPHIVIEYSTNLDAGVKKSELPKLLHKVVVDSGLFSPEAVKARAIAYNNYVLPPGAQSFMHVTTSILTGRSVEQRKSLNESIFQALKDTGLAIDKLSCDVREMVAETYKK